jgi:hypothetical protein
MATLFRPRRSPFFCHRAIISRRLRSYFKGRAQLWRSLSTNDRDYATQKAWLGSSCGFVRLAKLVGSLHGCRRALCLVCS